MTLTGQRHSHSNMHTHKKQPPRSHHVCRCLHVYKVQQRESGLRESGNEQRAPKAGRETEIEKDTTSEEGPLSSSILQATDTESHNSREQVNTPQAFFSCSTALSREHWSQSSLAPWLHHTHIQYCALTYTVCNVLYTYMKECSKGIRGEMTRK